MAALGAGRNRRELGRRVFARLYEGTAATFAAVATRMALGSGRVLEKSTMRARVGLLFDLPVGNAANADALALSLVTRRELREHWVERPSSGALPARRLAAKLIEHAAREAMVRSQQGDPHAQELLCDESLRLYFTRLLADREPLVWRHAAVARGLLACVDDRLRGEVEVGLDPALSPTEWRRAAVSLAAGVAADPEAGLADCQRILHGELAQSDRGIAATMVLGLPRVIEAEPDAAEELLKRISASRRADVAEAVAALLNDVKNPNFGVDVARELYELLSKRGDTRPSLLPGLAVRALRALDTEHATRETLQESIRQALVAYEATGAREAHQLAQSAAGRARELMETLGRDPFDFEHLPATLDALGDLDAGILERPRLYDLMLLGRRPGETDVSAPEMDELYDRLGRWLLDAEERTLELEWSRPIALANQRCLRALLHLVDLETAHRDSDVSVLRDRVARCVRVLAARLSAGPDESVHRILCATLARSFDAAVREGVYEGSDLLLACMHALTEPASIRAIAQASTSSDVGPTFGAYADFLEPAPDEAEDGQDDGAMKVAARLASLSRHIATGGSYRSEALRQVMVRLARGLETCATAHSLSELVDASGTGVDVVGLIESAAEALRQMLSGAVRRVLGGDFEPISVVADVAPLSALVERTVATGIPANQEQSAMATAELTSGLPEPIARASGVILDKIRFLPVAAAGDVEVVLAPARRAPLPDWLLPRRTLGAFYVVRALASGGAGSMFVARRFEERHHPNAEEFALKVPQYDPTTARSLSEQEFFQMFREEAGALLGLPQHPNLARFVTFDLSARPKPILVMELIEGLGLDRLIRSRSVQTGQAFGYLDGILNGLQAMHEAGVGHLDVKPSNVILRNGNTPVLVDFGLSGRHVRPGCGTVEYCAPEILGVTPKGVLPSPAACDLYSFGCTAFELLTGKLLFDAEDEMELLSAHLSHDGWPGNLMNLGRFPEFYELSVVLAACLRRDPRQRAGLAETRAALSVVASRIGTMAWPLRAPADA
jgi:hypothetical protein